MTRITTNAAWVNGWVVGLWMLAGVLFLPLSGRAMSSEDKEFKAAFDEFTDKQYHQAETDFTVFLNSYSNSVHGAEALLCKAQAQLLQSNNTAAINTLQERLSHAGDLAPNYIFYIAKATNALGDYRMAARGFANLIKQFPQSPLRLEAAYDEADAWSKLRDWARVVDLLGATNRTFQMAARAAGGSNEFVASGQLLLSKGLLEEGQAAAGEASLRAMRVAGLNAELSWERQFLLCQAELAEGEAAEAEADTTNLIARTETLGSRPRALSLALRGEILERRGNLAEALECYTNNLADDRLPEPIEREALANALQLMSRQGQTNAAAELLESLAQRPKFGALDLVRLNLGELCLAAYARQDTNAAYLGTNLLQRAGTNFESVIRDFPHSPLRGRAQLDDGWRHWTETNIAAARTNFLEAVGRLAHSEDQAVARFKLADAELYEHDNAGALSNYEAVIRDYRDLPAVTNKLFDLALYKILEASLALGDETEATDAVGKIMAWFPTSYYGGHGLLLLGEDLTRKNDYAMARHEFTELLKKPTPLQAEAEYAIARTYGLEGNWVAALPRYGQWVTNHPQSPLLPRVEFDRALAFDKAGQGSNALALMTNFVGSFASNSLAPWAQNWIADYYFNLPDYENAEKNYEELYVKWPNAEGDLAYRARFMAGKSALGRQDTREAGDYFRHLVNDDPNTPPSIAAQGYYALADTFFQQFVADPTNEPILNHAIAALSKLTNGAATNAMAPLALGRLGDYYFQGRDDAGAMRMYEAALACTNMIDAATRSQAEIGLGRVAYDQNERNEALSYYDKVLYDPDQTNPFWISQAGQAAGSICEDQGHWDAAVKVYERVLAAAPALRPALEKKIAAAQRMMDAGRN
jgi:TolA-binding protein